MVVWLRIYEYLELYFLNLQYLTIFLNNRVAVRINLILMSTSILEIPISFSFDDFDK